MSEIQERVMEMTDDQLMEQYLKHREEYIPEALEILKEEISRREIDENRYQELLRNKGEITRTEAASFSKEDFVQFQNIFSHTDILLAYAILREHKIPFYIDNPSSSETIPLESEAERVFTIHINKDHEAQAHELLEEHFSTHEGRYASKYTSIKDRLRAFNFHDIHLNEFEAAEVLTVSLSDKERATITNYGKKLLDEADAIEQEQERVLFYYDNIEGLLKKLSAENPTPSRTDLLTLIEILQVYCDREDFPADMDDTIRSLLGFFFG